MPVIPGGEGVGGAQELPPLIEVRLSNKTGEILSDGGSRSIGSFIQNTTTTVTVWVGNKGTTGSVLTIPINGISLETGSSATIQSNPSGSASINIPQASDGITFVVAENTSVVGNKFFQLNISSSDPTVVKFTYTFFFTITQPSVQSPDLAIIYSGSNVESGSALSLGAFPKDGVANISFQIYNYAVSSLVIPQNGITMTIIGSNEVFTSNPSDSSAVTLAFNESSSFAINLDSSSLGNKSAIILITSNDANENPFIFTISYSIAKAFDLSVQESLVQVSEDETVNLGSFNKKTIINRNISISNKGISYGIRLLSISSEGEVALIGIPSLPFVLQPNERNVVEFVSRFGSSTLGKKSASLKIQWEVSA